MRLTSFHGLLCLALLAAVRSENEDRPKRDVVITSTATGKDCNKSKVTATAQLPTITHTIAPAVTSPLLARLQACSWAKQRQDAYNQAYIKTLHDIVPAVQLPKIKPPLLYSYTDDFGREVPFVLSEDSAGEYSVSPFGVPQPVVAVPEPTPVVSVLNPILSEGVIVDNKPIVVDVPVVTITKDCKKTPKERLPVLTHAVPVSSRYSYTQKSKDGSIVTSANNGNVIVTETKNYMPPPPPYILDRFENILHGVHYGIAPVPVQTSAHIIHTPDVSTVSGIPQEYGSYSYKQINRDGSQLNYISGHSGKKAKGEKKLVIPVIPPIEPQIVPNPAVLAARPLYYSHPVIDDIPVQSNSGSYSYTQIHKDGTASVHGTSQASKDIILTNKPYAINASPQNNKQTSEAYSYTQLHTGGSSSSYVSGVSKNDNNENLEKKLVIPVQPPVAPVVLPNMMPLPYTGGYSYTQFHKDGSSSVLGATPSFVGSEAAVALQETSRLAGGNRAQKPNRFSYVQKNMGQTPNRYISSYKNAQGTSEDKLVIPVIPPLAPHIVQNPLYLSHLNNMNAQPSQMNSESYHYTQYNKDGTTSINGAPSVSIFEKESPHKNQLSGGYSYTQITNKDAVLKDTNNKQVPVLASVSQKPTVLKGSSGSYSYTQIHKNGSTTVLGGSAVGIDTQSTEAAKPYAKKQIEPSKNVNYSNSRTGSGFSFSQVYKNETVSNNPQVINSKITVGSIPNAPKFDSVTAQPLMQAGNGNWFVQPIISRYMYKQLSHSHPDPNAFVVVNIEDKNMKTVPVFQSVRGRNQESSHKPSSVVEVSKIPTDYVYVPPAFNDMSSSAVPMTVSNRPSGWSFNNNPIVVGDIPAQPFSYTQKKADGSSIEIKAENRNTVLVQNKDRENRNRQRGDIPDSYETE